MIFSQPLRMAFTCAVLLAFITVIALPAALAQTTIATGSIQGTITDPSGAVVPQAAVTITNQANGQTLHPVVSATGTYTSGALVPGNYKVRVEGKGFQTSELPVTVEVGETASGNIKLALGQESQVITVEAGAVRVNTEQPTVQGVLTAQQIENLPINGRNFLDLAQLEPGVQIQDGGNFDPTKNGFSSISFGGRFGRTARIEVDGIDISDETVGTTTQNIPQSSIQEFQTEQSTLDPSTELTSSGAVNVSTRTGTNSYHGEGYYLFRDKSTSANIGGDAPFQRNGFGGRFGGPIIKDKLFFFMDAERMKQALASPVILSGPFAGLTGNFSSPFKEKEALGRLDWQMTNNAHLFYRFSYDNNINVSGFIPNSYQPFANRDNTPVHAAGLDFTTGSFTHSIRLGYTKFTNHIADATGRPNDVFPGLSVAIGSSTSCLTPGLDFFCSGPNILAPQATFQANHQAKYDGSKVYKSHIIRYGADINRIDGGGFAAFFGLDPAVRGSFSAASQAAAAAGPFPGGASNPLNYPVQTIIMGNGQGFFTEKPHFGEPAGGQFDTRFQWYVGDSWKVKPSFTLTYALRYVRDTGRSDSDLAPIPCSALDTSVFPDVPCNGNIFDLFGAGLGNRVRQPNTNFAPEAGFAWDLFKNGSTVIRGGGGIFYENAIFNNVLFDRPARLAKGLFFATAVPCPSGSFSLPGTPPTTIDTSSICGQPIGVVGNQIIQLQQQYQAAALAAGPQVNPSFIGEALSAGVQSTGTNPFAPNYRSPRSYQMNIGVSRQMGKNGVLSVDFVRNVNVHFLLTVDTNHVGDARFLNMAAAQNAIATTLAQCKVPSIDAAIQACPGLHPGTPATPTTPAIPPAPASLADFAGNGLDSGNVFLSGAPAEAFGFTAATGAAFPGANPLLGQNQMLFPIGRSAYNGLQAKYRYSVANPIRGVRQANFQISYALSRFQGMATDQDFINPAGDQRNPSLFFGPSSLDHTHQLSFGGVFQISHGPLMSFTARFATALPQTLLLPAPNGGTGDIFTVDLTGDGSGFGAADMSQGDVLPGTNIGSFGRSVNAGSLNNLINNFNTNVAGGLTPAGQALVSAGLFTQAQLTSLHAVIPSITPAPAGQVGLDAFRAFDLKTSWPIHITERLVIEPSVSAYNLFNFANFDPPGQPLSGILDGSAGSANGTTNTFFGDTARTNRWRPGSGVFWNGVPRMFEWGMRLTF